MGELLTPVFGAGPLSDAANLERITAYKHFVLNGYEPVVEGPTLTIILVANFEPSLAEWIREHLRLRFRSHTPGEPTVIMRPDSVLWREGKSGYQIDVVQGCQLFSTAHVLEIAVGVGNTWRIIPPFFPTDRAPSIAAPIASLFCEKQIRAMRIEQSLRCQPNCRSTRVTLEIETEWLQADWLCNRASFRLTLMDGIVLESEDFSGLDQPFLQSTRRCIVVVPGIVRSEQIAHVDIVLKESPFTHRLL